MESIEEEFKKYNQIKIDLVNMSKCIQSCEGPQKNCYQNICLEYSKELKKIKKAIESDYGINICACCPPEALK